MGCHREAESRGDLKRGQGIASVTFVPFCLRQTGAMTVRYNPWGRKGETSFLWDNGDGNGSRGGSSMSVTGVYANDEVPVDVGTYYATDVSCT